MAHGYGSTIEGQSYAPTAREYARARWYELGHEVSTPNVMRERAARRDLGFDNPLQNCLQLIPSAQAWEADAQELAAADPIVSDALAWVTNGRIGQPLVPENHGDQPRADCDVCLAWGMVHPRGCQRPDPIKFEDELAAGDTE
jgi:hypothetical protein